jgi:hypothetical protein
MIRCQPFARKGHRSSVIILTMPSAEFDPKAGAWISAVLVKALTEAKMLADGGDTGPVFRPSCNTSAICTTCCSIN